MASHYTGMDKIIVKTPNPRCCFYWCLIELVDWRYGQSCWYFRPALWTINALTFSLASSPPSPLPCVNKYTVQYTHYTVCNGRGGGPRQIHMPQSPFKVPLHVNFFRWQHFALPSISLIFLRLPGRGGGRGRRWSWSQSAPPWSRTGPPCSRPGAASGCTLAPLLTMSGIFSGTNGPWIV